MIRSQPPVVNTVLSAKRLGRSRDLAIIVLCIVVVVVIANVAWNVRLALQEYRQSLATPAQAVELDTVADAEPEYIVRGTPRQIKRVRKHRDEPLKATSVPMFGTPERPKD